MDYKTILDQYGIKYHSGTPEEVEESIQKLDTIFEEWLSSMRDPTPEEWDSINNYIESISRPTGVNIFGLMDEYEKNQFDKWIKFWYNYNIE